MTGIRRKGNQTRNPLRSQNPTVRSRRLGAHSKALELLSMHKFSDSPGKLRVGHQRRRRHQRLRRYGGGVSTGHTVLHNKADGREEKSLNLCEVSSKKNDSGRWSVTPRVTLNERSAEKLPELFSLNPAVAPIEKE